MRDLGSLGGTGLYDSSAAFGFNDGGQVVGASSYTAEVAYHAFITGPDGMDMRDLDTLGPTDSSAYSINDAGQVVGQSYTLGGAQHAFITGPNGMDMRALGSLGGTGLYDSSGAFDINDAGQVVGYSDTAEGSRHAFITGPNGAGMTDLNSLVHLPYGVVLTDAYGINNAGQVIALAIPEPEISALFVIGLALIGFMARRKNMAQRVV